MAGGVDLFVAGEAGPPGPPGPGSILQVAYAALAADFISAAGTTDYQDILTVSLNTLGGTFLHVDSDLSASEVVATISPSFRITVDGVALPSIGRGINPSSLDQPSCAAFTGRVSAPAGLHEVKLQGANSTVVTQFQIRPVTQERTEGATLRVEEVSV